MAMTLRLDDVHEEILTELAIAHNRPKNEIIALAIEEMANNAAHSTRVRAAFDRILERDAEALELLSR
jgi:predicted transcriptional regulator